MILTVPLGDRLFVSRTQPVVSRIRLSVLILLSLEMAHHQHNKHS
ncbi:MAG: hypothetical protein ACKO4S_16080 [Snowella sp.]